jgi:hypothetical protein
MIESFLGLVLIQLSQVTLIGFGAAPFIGGNNSLDVNGR